MGLPSSAPAGNARTITASTLVAFAVAISAGCSLLVDSNADQCRSDNDCERFEGTVCDVERRLCVPVPGESDASVDGRSDAAAPGADGGAVDARVPDATSTFDATTDGTIAHDATAEAAPDATSDGTTGIDASDGATSVDSGSDATTGMDASDGATPVDSGPDTPVDPCTVAAASRPRVAVSGVLPATSTWGCDAVRVLTGTVTVPTGGTLTLQPGTVVEGGVGGDKGGLVVSVGAKILANGTRDRPVIFTSARPPASRAAGDWNGIVVAGRGRLNASYDATPFGVTVASGTEDTSDSGTMTFTRIEFTDAAALRFVGVGASTKLDSISVRRAKGSCFGFLGGSANAKHLLCSHAGGDGLAYGLGYRGKLQFVAVHGAGDPPLVAKRGLFGESNAASPAAAPASEPVIFNATFCGRNQGSNPTVDTGVVFAGGGRGHLYDVLVTGYSAAYDVIGIESRNAVQTNSTTVLNGMVSANQPAAVAFVENGSGGPETVDDDGAFDEVSWYTSPPWGNAVAATTVLPGCFTLPTPELRPTTVLSANASAPPDDGFFDANATYVGAFKDGTDTWAQGEWATVTY
ncbi:MAG: hypothetical protein U0169_21170 [Polyangiaceae bacterium]